MSANDARNPNAAAPRKPSRRSRGGWRDRYLKKTWQKVLTGMAAVAVFCTTYMLLIPTITMANPFCGLEEHEHDAACYTMELTCTLPELTEEEAQAAREAGDEGAVAHQHVDSCYSEVLSCGLKAHTHSLECYADREADKETAQDWIDSIASVKAQENPSKAETIAQIAKSQVGCAESDKNYEVIRDDAGNEAKAGYTRYGAWYDTAKPADDGASYLYADWDALFAAFCLQNADVSLDAASFDSDTQVWMDDLIAANNENFRAAGAQNFAVGDVVFLKQQVRQAGGAVEKPVAAIVVKAEDGNLRLISGNVADGDRDVVKEYDANYADEHLLYVLTVAPKEEAGKAAAPANELAEGEEKSDGGVDENAAESGVDENDAENAEKDEGEDIQSVGLSPLIGAEAWLIEEGDFAYLPSNILLRPLMNNVSSSIATSLLTTPRLLAAAPLLGDSSLAAVTGINVAEYLNPPYNPPDQTDGLKVLWREAGSSQDAPWKTLADIPVDDEGNQRMPANCQLRIEVKYADIDPKALQDNGYTLYLKSESGIKKMLANADVIIAGEKRGRIVATEDEVMLVLDKDFIDDVVADNQGKEGTSAYKKLSGNFFFQGQLDLAAIGEDGHGSLNFAGVSVDIHTDDNPVARYGDVAVVKGAKSELIKGDDGGWYLEYTMTVTASEYGSPAVSVLDTVTTPGYVEGSGYVGVTDTKEPAVWSPEGAAAHPVDSMQRKAGSVYLTSDTQASADGTYIPSRSGSKMVWEIGAMDPNEIRTLTYRVRVADSYVGIPHDGNSSIKNKAEAFSRQYPHGSDSNTYTPKVGTGLVKTGSNYRQGDDGSWYADFTVKVTAKSDNSYTLDNVKVRDDLDDDRNNGYRDYVSYVEDSLKLYKDAALTDEVTDLAQYRTGTRGGYKGDVNPYFADDGNAFELYVGDLEPNESRWVTYTMKLDAESAQMHANGAVGFYNLAETYPDDTRSSSLFERYRTAREISSQTWDRKLSGGQLTQNETIQIPAGADVYDASTGSTAVPLPRAANPGSYGISQGAYKYSVVVNEKGEWNMSTSTWGDAFAKKTLSDGKEYDVMKFAGYVKVDVYDSVPASGNQAALDANLAGRTPKKSVWVKVGDTASFNFSGPQIGLTNDTDAYVLTYYAVPTSGLPSYGQANVENYFTVSGTVGKGAGTYTLPGITTYVTTVVKEPGVDEPYKASWYYDPLDTSFVNNADHIAQKKGDNGAFYWVIKLTGSKVPAGTMVSDDTGARGGDSSWGRNNESYVGVYAIDLGEGSDAKNDASAFLEKYRTLDDLEGDVQLGLATKLPDDVCAPNWNSGQWYTRGNYRNWCSVAEFKKDYVLSPGTALYMVARTDPASLPGEGGSTTYKNTVRYKTNSTSWKELNTVSQTLIGPNGSLNKGNDGTFMVSNGGTTFKRYDAATNTLVPYPDALENNKSNATLQGRMICVDKNFASIGAGNGRHANSYVYEDGVYIAWTLKVNSSNTMAGSGDYVIEDALPEGVELAYVRTSGVGDNGGTDRMNPYNVNPQPKWDNYSIETIMARQNPQWVEEGWTEHRVAATLKINMARNRVGTYYYTNTVEGQNRVRLYIEEIKKDSPLQNNNSLEFQVVCRVTDPNIYFGDVEFGNTASLSKPDGTLVERDSDVPRVHTPGVDKQMMVDLNESGQLTNATVPYRIVTNDMAADMNEEGDVVPIPLVDRISSNLSFKMDTLRLYLDDDSNESNLLYSGASDASGRVIGNTNATSLGETQIRVAVDRYVDAQGVADGSQVLKFYDVPDEHKLIIRYSATATVHTGGGNGFSNSAYWEGNEGTQGGQTQVENLTYEAGATGRLSPHGTLRVTKYAGDDTSTTLAGAQFTLYKAKYNALNQLVLDENGKAQLDYSEQITEKTTDGNGLITYGLAAGEDNLHYNTVYGVKETKAPAGYALDPKEYLFVFPLEDNLSVNDLPYPQGGVWPDNVYLCRDYVGGKDLAYSLSVVDYRGSAQVTKDFGGNAPKYEAGSYTFGIWHEKDMPRNAEGVVDVSAVSGNDVMLGTKIASKTVTYEDSDFDRNDAGVATGIKEGHRKVATFEDLPIGDEENGDNYYIFELNDAGYPVAGGESATFGGERFTVSYETADGAGNRVTPEVDPATGQLVIPLVTCSNARYEAQVTKGFLSVGVDRAALDRGIAGTYTFGIQKKQKNGSWGYVDYDKVVTLEWVADDTDATKTGVFDSLEPNATYRIVEVELDPDTRTATPIEEGESVSNDAGDVFVVYYDEVRHHPVNAAEVSSDSASENVFTVLETETAEAVIGNQTTVELPATGGMGTTILYIAGGILAVGAGLALITRFILNRRDKK